MPNREREAGKHANTALHRQSVKPQHLTATAHYVKTTLLIMCVRLSRDLANTALDHPGHFFRMSYWWKNDLEQGKLRHREGFLCSEIK